MRKQYNTESVQDCSPELINTVPGLIDIIVDWETLIRQNSSYRKGQALFNLMQSELPEAVELLRATDVDPFYKDNPDVMKNFLSALINRYSDAAPDIEAVLNEYFVKNYEKLKGEDESL